MKLGIYTEGDYVERLNGIESFTITTYCEFAFDYGVALTVGTITNGN